ncbi:uncharacterized protein LOC141621277 [Silene latifolia]|uniref:uncharacterized protein LOC141621277 n=1 Tax=Silene latifolia TaxID=37657 RepID=UPI003D77BF4E
MGNCQAAEVAMVVVQHPENGKVDKMHWSVRANEVMGLNPGHYVALIVESPSDQPGKTGKNHLKLLKPDDTLHIGHVYRLISFEEVINGFAEKKSVKLGNLLKGSGATLDDDKNNNLGASASNLDNPLTESDNQQGGSGLIRSVGRRHCGGGQWRPALQSIAEF